RVAGIRRAADVLDNLAQSKALVAQMLAGRVARAKADIRTITVALQAFEVQFGTRPDALAQLTTPPAGRPFIEPTKDSLTAPWGRPYKYDPAGPKNGGLKPDVWSEGPDPNDKTKIIGNWPMGK